MSTHREFWNKEYKTSEHLALSDEPSEDLEKFCRWLERREGKRRLNPLGLALDLGSGNGRNLVFLAETYAMRGVGYDISDEAVRLAERRAKGLPVRFEARSLAGRIELPDESVDLVLDMMTSHYLKAKERAELRSEIFRILKPGGFLFLKTFLADGDLHVRRLLREFPADEPGAYIHPKIGAYEYAWTEGGIREAYEPPFVIEKIDRSHKHMKAGKAWKRRTVSVYLEKPAF